MRKLWVVGDQDDDSGVPLSVSVGVADYQPEDSSYDSLLRRADKALYAAKNAGRDRVASSPTSTASSPRGGTAVHAGTGTVTTIRAASQDAVL